MNETVDNESNVIEPLPSSQGLVGGKYAEIIEELIVQQFEYTKVKLSPDDPMIGILLSQKLDLERQFAAFDEKLANRLQHTETQSVQRLIEVDKRFQTAQELAEQLEGQRQKILTELGNIHQKNLIMYASEQSKKIDELKAWIGLSKISLAITTTTFFIVLIANLK